MISSYITNDGKRVGDYLLTKQIGEGQFGKVFLGKGIKDTRTYAIKQIDRSFIDSNDHLKRLLETEVSIMHDIDHPNILHLYEFLESSQNYYMVVDYCNQGNFLDYLESKNLKSLDESTAVYFLKQIANGFQELRKNKILHRDIKLENFFINNGILVIGDFGFAKRGFEMAKTKLGTLCTMAYEILSGMNSGTYDSKADLWSVGIVYFEMLFGELPFNGSNVKSIKQDILRKANGKLEFPKTVSVESKDLINRILVTDPDKRMSWEEFFNHPLFEKYSLKTNDDASVVFKELGQIFVEDKIIVEAEFNQNKQQLIQENKKAEQRLMTSDSIFDYSGTDRLQSKKVDEENFTHSNRTSLDRMIEIKQIYFKYIHEKEMINFLIYSIKKLHNAINQGYLKPLLPVMFDASVLLCKKAAYANEVNLNSLINLQNIYNLDTEYFVELKDSEEYEMLLADFYDLKVNIESSFKLTLSEAQKCNIKPSSLKSFDNDNKDIGFVDEQLNKLVSYFKQKTSSLSLDESQLVDYFGVIASLKLSVENRKMFPYAVGDGFTPRQFDWHKFYESFEKMKVKDLKQII